MKFTHSTYDVMGSRWQKSRDAAAGEYEVHEKGTLYLPKLALEKADEYKARVERTPFFNATWRTIIALRGMLFRRPATTNFTPVMEEASQNIDNTGMSLTSFSQQLSMESLTVGRSGVLVEHTAVPEGSTQAQANEIGAKPFLTMYSTESILDWKETNNGGIKVLSFVRLKEDPGNYPDIELKQNDQIHRLLMLEPGGYIQKIVKNDGENEEQVGVDIIPRMNNQPLPFIPFQPIGVDSLRMAIDPPPLIDLINMNFHHYRQTSSYEHGCFLSGLPTMFVYGNTDDKTVIHMGGSTANSMPNPEARAEFVEVKSNFEALANNLKSKEHQMAVLGARMLETKTAGVESAEAWARKQSGEESVLADISTTLSAGITKTLYWYTEWGGIDSTDLSYSLNKEFLPFALNAQQMTSIMGAYLQGGMSYESLYHNFDRAGLYPDGTTIEEEKGAIDEGGG